MSITEAVLQALASAPAKASEIAELTGIETEKVNGSLWALQKSGRVVKEGEARPFTWRLSNGSAFALTRTPRAPVAEYEADPDAPEIFVGRFAGGDVQIGVGEEVLRMSFGAAREVHALLANIVEDAE